MLQWFILGEAKAVVKMPEASSFSQAFGGVMPRAAGTAGAWLFPDSLPHQSPQHVGSSPILKDWMMSPWCLFKCRACELWFLLTSLQGRTMFW